MDDFERLQRDARTTTTTLLIERLWAGILATERDPLKRAKSHRDIMLSDVNDREMRVPEGADPEYCENIRQLTLSYLEEFWDRVDCCLEPYR